MFCDPFTNYVNKLKRAGKDFGVRKALIYFIHGLDVTDLAHEKLASSGELSSINARRMLYRRLHTWLAKKEDVETIFVPEHMYRDCKKESEREKKDLYKRIEELEATQNANGAMRNKLKHDQLQRFLARVQEVSICAAVLQGSTSCIERNTMAHCNACHIKKMATKLKAELEDVE